MSAWRDSTPSGAAASWTSSEERSSFRTLTARPSGSARRSRSSSGAVRCDTPSARISDTRGLPLGLGVPAGPLLGKAGQLAELSLDSLQLGRHDRDVDPDQDHEYDVGPGDALTRLIEGKGRHQSGLAATPGAIRGPPGPDPPSRARRSRESCAVAFFAVISSFTSVTHSSAIAASE